MPELYLKQPGFTYSVCGPFTKHRERIQKFRETGNLKHYLYWNQLNKTCFAHDTAYSNSKDLAKRTISDTILKDRTYEIARNSNYDRYQKALASMVYKFLDKKSRIKSKCKWTTSWKWHKLVIKRCKRRKVDLKTMFGHQI